MQQHVRNIILGQLWTQVAGVHHEYGRLTLATAGLLFTPSCGAVLCAGKTTDGLAVTSAGALACHCIIHLATPPAYDRKGPASKHWHERIVKCLERVEEMKMNSIAFPLLGTGQ